MRQGATTTSFRQSSFRGAVNSAGFQSSPMVVGSFHNTKMNLQTSTTLPTASHTFSFRRGGDNCNNATSKPIIHRSNRSSATTESIATQSMGTISAKSFAATSMSASLAGNNHNYSLSSERRQNISPSAGLEPDSNSTNRVGQSNKNTTAATMSIEDRLSLGVQRSATRFHSTDIQQGGEDEGISSGGDNAPVMIINGGGHGNASSSRRRQSRRRRSRRGSRPSNLANKDGHSRKRKGSARSCCSTSCRRFDSIGGLFGYPEDIDSTFRVSPSELVGDNVGRFFLFLILFLLTQAAANIGMLLFREQSLFEGDASSDNNEEHALQEYLMIPPSYCYYTMPLVLLTTFAHMLERADPTPRGAFPRKVVRILAFCVNAMFWVLVGLYVSEVMEVDNLESRFVGISGVYCISYLVALFYFPRKFTEFGGSAVSDVVKRVEMTCAIFATCSIIRFSLLIDPVQDWLEGSVGSRWFFAIYMPLDIIPCLLIMNFLYRRTQNVALISLRNHKRREKKRRRRRQQEEEEAAERSRRANCLSSEVSPVERAQQKSLDCGPLKSGFKGVGSSERPSSTAVIGDCGGVGGGSATTCSTRPSVGVDSAASTPFNSMAPLRMDSHRSVLDGFASPPRMAPTRHGSEEGNDDSPHDGHTFMNVGGDASPTVPRPHSICNDGEEDRSKGGRPPLSSSLPLSRFNNTSAREPSVAINDETFSPESHHCTSTLGAPLMVAGDCYPTRSGEGDDRRVQISPSPSHLCVNGLYRHDHDHEVDDDESDDYLRGGGSGGDGDADYNDNPSASYLHSKAVSALLFEELVSAAGPLSSSSPLLLTANNMGGGEGTNDNRSDDSSDEEDGEVSDSTASDEEP